MAKARSTKKAAQPAFVPGDQAPPVLQLEYLEIKDVEDAKLRLLEALDGNAAVCIGVGRVTTVDTAGVQLLLAFKAEAATRGIAVEIYGESAPLNAAITLLGLRDQLQIASRRD